MIMFGHTFKYSQINYEVAFFLYIWWVFLAKLLFQPSLINLFSISVRTTRSGLLLGSYKGPIYEGYICLHQTKDLFWIQRSNHCSNIAYLASRASMVTFLSHFRLLNLQLRNIKVCYFCRPHRRNQQNT